MEECKETFLIFFGIAIMAFFIYCLVVGEEGNWQSIIGFIFLALVALCFLVGIGFLIYNWLHKNWTRAVSRATRELK